MAGYSDELQPFEVARGVLMRQRRFGYYLISGGVIFMFLGIAGLSGGAGVGALFVAVALVLIVLGYLLLRRTSIPKGLLPISSWVSKRHYFIGSDGIYMDRELIVRWGDVNDIKVIDERDVVRPYLSLDKYLRTRTTMAEFVKVREGVIRVYLRDGRTVDVPYVIYPTQVVEYVRREYLGRQ